jgi:ubiquinone/menaquinone biosynthesis C-methylase UbiE
MTNAADHYAGGRDLVARALELLRAAGKDVERLTLDDLTGLDEFHIRGRDATLSLVARLALRGDERVLDVGSGIGGPARRLASLHPGIDVTGIDLTPEFCRLANELSRRVGLAARVRFETADATRLPFADAVFDVAWTQHVQMNVADKTAFYGEIARVLKPGGRFALYDILQGPGGAVRYPAPWAADASHSHLVTPEAMRRLVAAAGLVVEQWADVTAAGRDWAAQRAANPPAPGAISTGALLGDAIRAGSANIPRNLDEGRIALVEAIARKPARP